MVAGDRVEILSKPNGIKMFEGVVNINNRVNIDWAYHGSSVNPGDVMAITDQYTYKVIESAKTEVVESVDAEEPEVDDKAFAPSPAPIKKISKRRR